MTLDDETAGRIAEEAVERAHPAWPTDEALVRAGYAYRDAEVEELRADLRAKTRVNARMSDRYVEAERSRQQALATLAKVREYIGPAENGPWHSTYRFDILAILDESPTERETPANREDVARVLRDANRPDVPTQLPPSRNYLDMATALMERFTITDGAHSSSVSITSPEVTTSDAVSGATPAEEHVHDWKRRQNITTRGYAMPPYWACECGAARAGGGFR